MVKTHISPKGINQGGFPQNHVAVDGDDMAVHDVGIRERPEFGRAYGMHCTQPEVCMPDRYRFRPHKREPHVNWQGLVKNVVCAPENTLRGF